MIRYNLYKCCYNTGPSDIGYANGILFDNKYNNYFSFYWPSEKDIKRTSVRFSPLDHYYGNLYCFGVRPTALYQFDYEDEFDTQEDVIYHLLAENFSAFL